MRQDQATQATTNNNNSAQVNANIQTIQQDIHAIQAVQQQHTTQINTLQTNPPAASPITLSPADLQNAITAGLTTYATQQGTTTIPPVIATGTTPAQQVTQGQPPTTALIPAAQAPATAPAAQSKKLLLGSVLFWHIDPDNLPPSAVENYQFIHDKTHQTWTKKNTLSAFLSPHWGLKQFEKHCSCPIPLQQLLHPTIDGFYIMSEEYDRKYETIFVNAPSDCPTWLDVPADQTPSYVVCRDRIYALGPHGKLYYEQQLTQLTLAYSPDPSRDMNHVDSPFYNHSGHVPPTALHPLAHQYCISLLRFCTPADDDANDALPFVPELEDAMKLPIPGLQLLMFFHSKITSWAPQNLDHIITSLKAKITRTLELFTADVEPIYLLTFIQDILRQAGHVTGPVSLKEDVIFDQVLTKFKSVYPPQLTSDGRATHRAKCVAKIMDARINPGSHTDDYRAYAQFDSLETLKQKLLKSALANNMSPASSPRPNFLLTKDFVNEIRQQSLDKSAAEANAAAVPPRGRQPFRSRSPSGRSRSDRSSHSSGRSSRSRDKHPRFRHPSRALLLDADNAHPAETTDPETGYCHLFQYLYHVAVETDNHGLIEVLESASDIHHVSVRNNPDDEEIADGILCLTYETCYALIEQDCNENTWEIVWAMAHIVAGKRLPRLPRGLRDRIKRKANQLVTTANTTSFADGQARSAQKHPKLRDGQKDKEKKPRDKKQSHRKHRSPGRLRQDQHQTSTKDKASPMEQLALKMKQLMKILKQPKPDGSDPVTWYRQLIYQGLQMLQEMILKVHTRLPKSQHRQGVRTIASMWTFHPQPPTVDDGAESDATVDDPLF